MTAQTQGTGNSLETPNVDDFSQYLRRHATEYFANGEPVAVTARLVRGHERAKSTIYEFELAFAGQRHIVLAKIPIVEPPDLRCQNGQTAHRGQLPRDCPPVNPADKAWLEYQALTSIHDHITSLGDARFGAIRILDFVTPYGAILSEKIAAPSLARLLVRANRFSSLDDSSVLDQAFHNCGAWLRAFHAMPKRNGVEVRPANRASFIKLVERFAGYLGEKIEDERFFDWTIAKVSKAADENLPNELPCGTKHGDFAMRNILVGADGRVTVLDTLAKWWAPVYTDIAYFLTALKTTRPQILTQGMTFSSSRLARYEQELLRGYFQDDPIPLGAIRLFEVLSLLDRLASTSTRIANRTAGGGERLVDRIQLWLTYRFLRGSIRQRLASFQ